MANPKHLEILKKGVEAWNRWRKQNPDIQPILGRANLGEANLMRVDLHGADLKRVDLHGANLQGANLINAWLDGADLRNADLSGADLAKATPCMADLIRANLGGADLSGADLSGANFLGANLAKADLGGANLVGSTLVSVDLEGANLREAYLEVTALGNLDLSSAVGLAEVDHNGPSTIGTDTLENTAKGLSKYRSRQGEVEIFLRGAGVAEGHIEFFRSQIGQPIEFYTSFISYSHNDKAFARRLYDSLQGRGIRCWLDEHALVPGDRIIRVVNEAIRVNDKLLLCCSEAALQSSWVEDEIAAAIKKERAERRDVLIPLNLDGYFFDWEGDHSVRIQERLAADFTGWESDNAKFEREFEKVVEALRPRAKD